MARCKHLDCTLKEAHISYAEWEVLGGVPDDGGGYVGDAMPTEQIEIVCFDCGKQMSFNLKSAPLWVKRLHEKCINLNDTEGGHEV
ncbi:unnamed protein product [marine sediment metagenome]|uniref:Uncharacterized protein n=1 Tax=marine sediment metagenome TaxID=412755 RepID=X0WD74_9ZZZZ